MPSDQQDDQVRRTLDAVWRIESPRLIAALTRVSGDLSLAEDVLQDQSIVTIRWVRYRQQMWNTTGTRRHLALWFEGDGAMDYYRIADATDPADYLTETLTLDPIAVRDYPMVTTVLSFLKLCRLEDDLVEISYPSGNVAETTIRVRELPLEAPV